MSTARVLILYGGRSSEHQVSCLSARSVLEVIDRDRYEVVPVGITRDGRWVLTDGDIEAAPGQALPEVTDEDGPTVALVRTPQGAGAGAVRATTTPPATSGPSTWPSPCCTARTARTAPCRATWRPWGCPTSVRT